MTSVTSLASLASLSIITAEEPSAAKRDAQSYAADPVNLNLLLGLTERCRDETPPDQPRGIRSARSATARPNPRCFCPNRGQKCCAGKRVRERLS